MLYCSFILTSQLMCFFCILCIILFNDNMCTCKRQFMNKQNDIHDNHNSNKGCSRFELPSMFLVTFAVYSKVNSRYFMFT